MKALLAVLLLLVGCSSLTELGDEVGAVTEQLVSCGTPYLPRANGEMNYGMPAGTHKNPPYVFCPGGNPVHCTDDEFRNPPDDDVTASTADYRYWWTPTMGNIPADSKGFGWTDVAAKSLFTPAQWANVRSSPKWQIDVSYSTAGVQGIGMWALSNNQWFKMSCLGGPSGNCNLNAPNGDQRLFEAPASKADAEQPRTWAMMNWFPMSGLYPGLFIHKVTTVLVFDYAGSSCPFNL